MLLCVSLQADTLITTRQLSMLAEQTPLVERPAKAAELIASAPHSQRERMAIRTIRVFLREAHSLAPSLIAAVADQTPEVIVASTTEAVRLFPEDAYNIVRAAVAKAPDFAIEIALRLSVENISQAQSIFAGTLAAKPELAPLLLTALEQPEELKRSESQASLIFRGKQRHIRPKPTRPRPSIDISRESRGVWVIHIDVPKGYYGNQIAQQLRRILRHLLSHPRLRSKFKIVIHRYSH